MIPYAVRMPTSLIEEAKNRAGMIPFNRIIRALIRMWLAGEVTDEQLKKYDQ